MVLSFTGDYSVIDTWNYSAIAHPCKPNEPPHIHIDRDKSSAKFWLEPVSFGNNLGFSGKELRKVESIVQENQQPLLEARQ